MTSPLDPLPGSRSSLLKPLDERDILVSSEQVYYAERQHWAAVARPIYETFIFLLFVVWIVNQVSGSNFGYGWIGVALLVTTIQAVVAIAAGASRTSRLAIDPFTNGEYKVSRGVLAAIILSVALVGIFFGIRVLAMMATVVVVIRLVVILARWSFYERRYITNRRVIEAGGFFGSKISSMPLSRVTDISYFRTVPGELFGYATMRVETAGDEQALGVVRYIANPDHFYEVLINFSAPTEVHGS